MEVRLKVFVGPNAGKELPVAGPKFLMGRAEDCQLRPRSDLISRHHCVLLIEDGLVIGARFWQQEWHAQSTARGCAASAN